MVYSYNIRPAPYTQTTLVQPYNTTIPDDSRIRGLQPEYAYQQVRLPEIKF